MSAMALEFHHSPRHSEVASPSPSGTRVTHSRRMSSLSMTTFTTTSQSHHQSEPLLRNVDYQGTITREPLRPVVSAEEVGYSEMGLQQRARRFRLLEGILLSIIGSWASYTTVRYFVAFAVYSNNTRRSVALSLGISSLLSLLLATALALSLVFPYYTNHDRSGSRSLRKSICPISRFLTSFFLFAPAAVNLALVFAWKDTSSTLSLSGRCHWDLDVVWMGVGRQCTAHAPAWGVWLAAAISRLALTVTVLIVYHFASTRNRASQCLPRYRPGDLRRTGTVEITQIVQSDAPSRPSPVLRPFFQKSETSNVTQPSLSSGRMAAIPEFNDLRHQIRHYYEHEYAGLDSTDSSTLSEDDSNPRSAESSNTPSRSLRRKANSRDLHAGESSPGREALVSNVREGELEGFADRFRSIVDRVSRELEDARNLESDPQPRTPPLHHVLDTHTPYMSIDEFGREVPSEEPIPMLGGIIKRMPTIESVGSREFASLRSTTIASGGGGGINSPSVGTSSSSSRPPTRATMVSFNDAASASLASASQHSSRSNSIHRPLMSSELGELVRDALRTRGQPPPRSLPPHVTSTPVRPGSVGSGASTGEFVRSRSNSVGPGEALAPVTEHGEFGREDGLWRAPPPPRRLCDTPDQLSSASEMGELVRTEGSRSWGSSSASATSTAYFTAGTGSTTGATDSGTGTGSSGVPR
ncbi:hypothetical protein B0F90DRAFT_1822484 [Multifurca ochricompacta]|uniref:Uncharacterized protein n=1 Tax=Multifurca ochricompacta TaxID=376703 RepID=A0AAD4QJV5_9AGAM|nr:hypothetical protein B0F90DRAFT_1822484 [Multifurca ochricompacta]